MAANSREDGGTDEDTGRCGASGWGQDKKREETKGGEERNVVSTTAVKSTSD